MTADHAVMLVLVVRPARRQVVVDVQAVQVDLAAPPVVPTVVRRVKPLRPLTRAQQSQTMQLVKPTRPRL